MRHSVSNGSGRTLRALLVCPDQGMAAELRRVLELELPGAAVTAVSSYPRFDGQDCLPDAAALDLCFVDALTDTEASVAVLERLGKAAPRPLTVALVPGNQPDLILRCLRHGAWDFLVRPFTPRQIQRVLEKHSRSLGEAPAPGRRVGKVYCVVPAKGACGATTLAANLACQWGRLGLGKVLLADLDPLTGTHAFVFKLKSNYSFVHALAHAGNLDADLWKALVTSFQGIDVLLAPENPADGIGELPDPGPLVEYARQAYQIVVLDAGEPYGDWNLSLARLCDEVLLVTTNELPALYGVRRALGYFEQHGVERGKIRLLVNRYRRDTGLDREAIETALKTEPFAVLPKDDSALQKALMEGKPLAPATDLAKAVAEVAGRLAGRPAVPEKTGGSWSRLRAVFSRCAR